MIGKITIQLCDYHTRSYIGNGFKSSYRLHKDDEVYYAERNNRFYDTVWTVMFCRTESFDSSRQVVFVIPNNKQAIDKLKKRDLEYSKPFHNE